MKKITNLFLVFFIILSTVIALPVNASAANNVFQDGLEVSVLTDKDEYSENEEVQVFLNVKNINAYKVAGISIKTELPEGLVLKSGNISVNNIDIEANSSYSDSIFVQLSDEFKNTEEINPDNTVKPEEINPDDTVKPDDNKEGDYRFFP